MSSIDDQDPAARNLVEHKPRQSGFWLKNLTGMEAFRYRAWRAGIERELDQACEEFIRSERGEWQLVEEMLAASKVVKPAEVVSAPELVVVPAAKETA